MSYSGMGATASASLSFNVGTSSGSSGTKTAAVTSGKPVSALDIVKRTQAAIEDAKRKAMIEAARKASSEAASRAGAIAAQAEAAAKRAAAEREASSQDKSLSVGDSSITNYLLIGSALAAAGAVGYLVLKK